MGADSRKIGPLASLLQFPFPGVSLMASRPWTLFHCGAPVALRFSYRYRGGMALALAPVGEDTPGLFPCSGKQTKREMERAVREWHGAEFSAALPSTGHPLHHSAKESPRRGHRPAGLGTTTPGGGGSSPAAPLPPLGPEKIFGIL